VITFLFAKVTVPLLDEVRWLAAGVLGIPTEKNVPAGSERKLTLVAGIDRTFSDLTRASGLRADGGYSLD